MKILGVLGLLVGLAAWGYAALMGVNLLSGSMEARTCKTECIQSYFFISGGLAFIALLLGGMSLRTKSFFSIAATLLGLGLLGIYGFLYIAGNFF